MSCDLDYKHRLANLLRDEPEPFVSDGLIGFLGGCLFACVVVQGFIVLTGGL